MKVAELYNNKSSICPLENTSFFCGLELEIERVKEHGTYAEKYWQIDTDDSLRENGFEYKIGPVTYDKAIEHFIGLHKTLVTGNSAFSERTSIHVHVNVGSLEVDQVKQLILTYALLEPLFLEFVGVKRKNSIFCVPLNYTFLPSLYKHELKILHNKWSKYTAFNICPLGMHEHSGGLHTVEFRHLYGTNDVEVFKTWLSAIKELYEFIANTPDVDIVNLLRNRTPVYMIAQTVVPSLAKRHSFQEIEQMCADTVLDVKLSEGGLAK